MLDLEWIERVGKSFLQLNAKCKVKALLVLEYLFSFAVW